MNAKIKRLANECLNCPNKPCQKGCPLANDIPSFINCIKQDNLEEAYQILTTTTYLSSLCGRICPHSKQCEGKCIRGIKSKPVSIGVLEAFVGDYGLSYPLPLEKQKKKTHLHVAVIGSGPAGITCATKLIQLGYHVTLFEKEKELGGLLYYGIPSFRLEKSIVKKNLEKLTALGITVKTTTQLGKDITLTSLGSSFHAIFLAFGAPYSTRLGLEGEDAQNVIGANLLLRKKFELDLKDKTVSVIGGGNTAMDAARYLKRLGAKEVLILYRRSKQEMPSEEKEYRDAIKDGIKFLFQTNLAKLHVKNNLVYEIECVKTKLVSQTQDTRKVPLDIEGSNFTMPVDYLIPAIGSEVNKKAIGLLKLETNYKGFIQIDEHYTTSKPGIFAGGDLTGAFPTVAWSARSGRDAAASIDEYLKNLD